MDNILWLSMSRMFALGVVILLSCCITQSMQCDLTKEHPVIDETSNKTLYCMKCKPCKLGKEPVIPCGTPVGRFEQVGDCRPCKNGTYSATVDSRQCQICRSEKCFEHQVIEGTCLANQRDETYCIEKCVNGYIMNKEGTACEVLTPQQNTTEKPTTSNPTTSNPTTSNPTTSNPTTMKSTTNPTTSNLKGKTFTTSNHTTNSTITAKKVVVSNNQKETMNVPLIVVIVVVIVFFVIILAIMYKFVWPHLRTLQTTEPQGEKLEDVELLEVSVEGKDEPRKQEESIETDLPEANGPPRCLGNNDGFDSTRNIHVGYCDTTVIANPVASYIANDANMDYMSSTPPPGNDSVVLEMPAQSPAQTAFGPLRQPEVMAPSRQQPFHPTQVPPLMHNFNHPDPTRFDCYPVELYSNICCTFDNGSPFQDAMALAGWLDITVNQNRAIEKKENRTDLIINSWMKRRENTVAKFVQILNDHGMTHLADEIKACQVRLMQYR